MRDFASLAAAALVGAVLALAGHWLLATPATADPATGGSASTAPAQGRVDAPPALDVARIEGQLEKLTAAVTALERRFDVAAERTPVRASADRTAAFDGDAMVRAIDKAREKQERARLADRPRDGSPRSSSSPDPDRRARW